jgi:hypothetical protein
MYAGAILYYDLPVAENTFGETAIVSVFVGTVSFIKLTSNTMSARPTYEDIGTY